MMARAQKRSAVFLISGTGAVLLLMVMSVNRCYCLGGMRMRFLFETSDMD